MKPLAQAAALVALHLAMRALGFAEHTSILAGMPVAASSILLGPLYVVVYLLAVVAAPILVLAALFERMARMRYARRGTGRFTSAT